MHNHLKPHLIIIKHVKKKIFCFYFKDYGSGSPIYCGAAFFGTS